MKKMVLLKLIALLVITDTMAITQEFQFGFVSGLNIANARLIHKPAIDGQPVFYPMVSYNVNGHIGFKITGFWGILAEPGYIQKGGVQKYDKDIRFQMNYLQLPLLANFYFGEKFFISLGPEFAYLMNVKAKSKDYSYDISDMYDNDFEISGNFRINYNVHKHFDIGLQYSHGLIYTSKLNFTDVTGSLNGESKEYNQYFQVFVRLKL
jgi:hypothetical protein